MTSKQDLICDWCNTIMGEMRLEGNSWKETVCARCLAKKSAKIIRATVTAFLEDSTHKRRPVKISETFADCNAGYVVLAKLITLVGNCQVYLRQGYVIKKMTLQMEEKDL